VSFIDTTITPAAGFTYVHNGQIYDAIATQLAAHSAWSLVDTVDYVFSTTTTRNYVWKCSSLVSGLPLDFYLDFQVDFTTIGTVYSTTPQNSLRVFMFERYDAATKTASYGACEVTSTAVAITSDNTHPGTWTLTAAFPNTVANAWKYKYIGSTAATSVRLLISVTAKRIQVMWDKAAQGFIYVGAFDSILSASDDPMPLILFGTGGNISAPAVTTRHPKLAPGSYQYIFEMMQNMYFLVNATSAGYNVPAYGPLYTPNLLGGAAGILGDPTNANNNMFINGVLMCRLPLTMCSGTTGAAYNSSTRGSIRGFMSHVLATSLPVHSYGDTFLVEGKVYVGAGQINNWGVLDTTV